VAITEKIHGRNCRVGVICDDPLKDAWGFMAGSHDMRRREHDAEGRKSDFWIPLNPSAKSMLNYIACGADHSVIAVFELFGWDITDMKYGCREEEKKFRLIDIAIDGMYIDFDDKLAHSRTFGVDAVPLLYRGPYFAEKVEELTNGYTTACDPKDAGPFKCREGIVITPVIERMSEELTGRAILKSVSVDFLARKGARDAR
jgi:hypothetical protein